MRTFWYYITAIFRAWADLFTPPQDKYRDMGLFAETDAEAIKSDWQKVGDYIRKALGVLE